MKYKILPFLIFLFFQSIIIYGQEEEVLPRGLSESEAFDLQTGTVSFLSPPPTSPDWVSPPPGTVRSLAEWEELEAVVITWTGSGGITAILKEIVRYAKEEVQVIIICSSPALVTNLLAGVGINTDNITFVQAGFDSIWVRDYGPNTVYLNDVGERYLIDWIYNRPRPEDDVTVPSAVAAELNIPMYSSTAAPTDLVHTGGNYMTDGMGTGFSSSLVYDENGIFNNYGTSNHTAEDIDTLMNTYMGIDIGRYVVMGKLDYDLIHHIDMHMKLLDEETLIVGQYPEGVADGPKIEANIQYILANYLTPYGNPYKVIRIPMPPQGGAYPDGTNLGGDYRTYTNAIFLNKTILVPTYEEQYDTTALRIWREAKPGYKIQGINCNAIIPLFGAIHCITKEVGVAEPLLINHSVVQKGCTEEDMDIVATFKHQSGIASATLFYSTDTTAGFQEVAMTGVGDDTWSGVIPATHVETQMFYYLQATAVSGKQIVRPLVAPTGTWQYPVTGLANCSVATTDLNTALDLQKIYPNPTNGITVIPVATSKNVAAEITVTDILGRKIETIFSGKITQGEHNYFLHAKNYQSGIYFINLKTDEQILVQKLLVK